MDRLRRALDAVFPIIFQGGITRAMYRAEGEDLEEPDGVAVDYQEWPVIESAARSVLDAKMLPRFCVTHDARVWGDRDGPCLFIDAMKFNGLWEPDFQPCRIESRLLVEEPGE